MKLRPDLCLVKLAPPTIHGSGLVLATAFTPAICYGKVMDRGADVYDVQPGDVVAFNPAYGEPIHDPYFTVPHLLIAEDAIDAVIPKRDQEQQTA
jgi:hypothetical protein